MEKPKVYFKSKGPSGNTLSILCAVMDKVGKDVDTNALMGRVLKAKSYEEAMSIMGEVADLVDLDKGN